MKKLEIAKGGIQWKKAEKELMWKWLKENYESITIRVPKGTREQIKEWADTAGLSMASYIQEACREKAEKV